MAREILKVLRDDQIERLDKTVMTILSRTGLEVSSTRAREILVNAGCSHNGNSLVFPVPLVRECVRRVPETFTLQGLDGRQKVTIGDGKTHFQPMVGRLYIIDADGSKRKTNLDDIGRIVSVCDALDNYDILHGGAVMPQIEGVPVKLSHLAGFVETLRKTGKPFKGSCRGSKTADDCLELADTVSSSTGTRFDLHTTCNIISPLQMGEDMVEGALRYIQKGYPVDFASEPQMGATSPVTLAGTLAQSLAECLAGVVLAQLANPGCPVFIGTVAAAIDMRHATIALGGVEGAVANAAHAQMARYYGIPSRGTGSNSDAKVLNFQAGYEKMLTLLLPVLAGMDMIFYPGTLDHAESVSLESLVLDHDLCSIALRAQREIRFSEDLLSVDLINNVGPGGAFLGLPQTAREMFIEHLYGGLWDRRKREDWVASGSPSPISVAEDQIEKIFDKPKNPLPDTVETALMSIAKRISEREGSPDLVKKLWN